MTDTMLMGQKYIKNIILYGGLGLLCIVNIEQLWKVMLIFFGLATFYVWLAYRHWNDEASTADKVKDKVKQGILSGLMKSGKEKRERKEQYQNYLSEIEKEFSMEEFEDDEYDDEE